ncbi:MAG TPA: M1 family metallopeptidase, partial [Myxococcaceae bacterium]|nr:M1 family metallopeptidase [Myxococcaceae bacterium]
MSLRPLPLLAALSVACAAPPAPQLETKTVPPTPGIVVAKDLAAPEPPPGMRLPAGLRPLAQRVELTIVPSSETFQGTTELDVEVASATDVLWLNAKKLTVERASARLGDAEVRAQVSLSPERVALRFPQPLPPGRMTLRLAFTGTISGTEDAGIFHQREGGDWYAMTQFEETDARRAFPCFDEPSVKIPWELTLVVPSQLLAVSNTKVASEEPAGPEMKRIRFARTKPLPSYLVAFGVGPYDTVDARPAGMNKVPMRIYAPRGRASEAAYAVRVSPDILETLEAYFGVPYAYEKLDLLVIPLTVHFGAMENAGLVTFASSRLLARPENESLKFQRIFAAIAAHEFAHQWFGDLVTLAWWDDIWLNESFATWAENKALDSWKPSWGIQMDDVRERSYAADRDTLVSARQIRQPIESYDDISNAFDAITYQKGAAVLRMFETYVGEETFRKGVQRYLQTHAYGNATARDFVAAISESSGRDMWPPFDSFLDRPGVPQITMRLACAPGKPAELRLSQERLLPLGTTGTAAAPWQVPVCARWSSGGKDRQACTLMTGPTATLALDGPSCPAWVIPNVAYAG